MRVPQNTTCLVNHSCFSPSSPNSLALCHTHLQQADAHGALIAREQPDHAGDDLLGELLL